MVARRLCDSHQRRVSFLFKAYLILCLQITNPINHDTDYGKGDQALGGCQDVLFTPFSLFLLDICQQLFIKDVVAQRCSVSQYH